MKRKVFKFITLLSLVTSMMFSTPAFAQTSLNTQNKTIDDLEINYTTMLGHEGRSYDELVQEMLKDGLTQDDADYYSKVDILVNQIELQNIDIDTCLKNEQKFSDDYVRLNPDKLKDGVLKLDTRALKTVLSQNDALFQGSNDTKDAAQTLSNNGYNVTIEYADGSKAILLGNTVKDQSEDSEVKTNTNFVGPWNSSYMWDFDLSDKAAGNYVSTSSWTYTSGVSYANVEDVFHWTLGTTKKTVTAVSDTGASSYAGVVKVLK